MGNASSILHQAVDSGDLKRVRVAVQHYPTQIDDTEPTHGWTALHLSASRGYDVIVRELLARGATPNLVDKAGRTALHLAAAEGHAVVVKDLLRRGADPLRRDDSGRLPIDLANEAQQQVVAGMLADAMAGRGVSTPTASGSPAAWQARSQAQPDVPVAGSQGVRVMVPDFANLGITPTASVGYLQTEDSTHSAAGDSHHRGGAYPQVPAPLPTAYDDSWLSQLPVPPGMSVSVPSAPPAPVSAVPAGQKAAAPAASALPDYYSYIRPLPPYVAAETAAVPAYPTVPGGLPPSAAINSHPIQLQPSWPTPEQQQQHQQLQLPTLQPQWPPSAELRQPGRQQEPTATQLPPAGANVAAVAAAKDEDDDGGWGAGADDDWGEVGGRPSVAYSRPALRPPPDLVGAAVTGASKVMGAMASTAVTGAKHVLNGLIPRAPGKADTSRHDSPSKFMNMPGASFVGPAGRTYSYEELARATQGFNEANKLGAGGFGPVYRGMLDGVPVAIKLLDTSGLSMQGPKEFAAEVAILSRMHHPHIVLLMGSCPERCGLVYELMHYGSLEQHLFAPSLPDLAWQDRIRIACETVSALVFLHSAPEPIIHMDLKPGNLLLNRSLVCKVGDVGLSRLMPGAASRIELEGVQATSKMRPPESTMLDSRLVGTPSYMDPEYLRTGRCGPKSDTYSLGVILLQMLTGLEASRVVSVVEGALAKCQGDAASFATIIDPRSGSWPITEAASFAHLAMRCVEFSRTNRPDLRSEVLPALLQLADRAKLYDTRAVKRSISLSINAQPPSMFVCPITQDVMEDPVFAADGYTYEREAIAGWIEHHNTSPMTNLPLPHTNITPNLAIRSAIKEWQEKHGPQSR